MEQVRSVSKYGLSVVTVVFDDATDIYFARQLVMERLLEAGSRMPPGVVPVLGPVSTGLGEVYQYTLDHPDDGDRQLTAALEAGNARGGDDPVADVGHVACDQLELLKLLAHGCDHPRRLNQARVAAQFVGRLLDVDWWTGLRWIGGRGSWAKVFYKQEFRAGIDERLRSLLLAKTENLQSVGPQAHRQRREIRVAGGNAHVAGNRHVDPTANAIATYARERGFAELGNAGAFGELDPDFRDQHAFEIEADDLHGGADRGWFGAPGWYPSAVATPAATPVPIARERAAWARPR